MQKNSVGGVGVAILRNIYDNTHTDTDQIITYMTSILLIHKKVENTEKIHFVNSSL